MIAEPPPVKGARLRAESLTVTSPSIRRARTRPARLLAVLTGGLVVAGGLTSAARADTSEEVRARAEATVARITAMQPRIDAAREAYELSVGRLSNAVVTQVDAQRYADASALELSAAEATRERRVRDLYLDAGAALHAALFEGPAALDSRQAYVAALLRADASAVTQAQTTHTDAVSAADRLDHHADDAVVTVGSVQQRYADVVALLDDAQRQLATLDAQAQQLREVEILQAQLAAQQAAADAARAAAASSVRAGGIPIDFFHLYQGAALTCPGLPWVVLAAIGQVETGHGSNHNDSSAGAQGPMQFLPSTFAGYAVDGDGDGDAEIRDPADAVYSAAAYLCANHGGRDAVGLRSAIWHYNHANWYVEMVLGIAAQLAVRFNEPPPPPYEPVV